MDSRSRGRWSPLLLHDERRPFELASVEEDGHVVVRAVLEGSANTVVGGLNGRSQQLIPIDKTPVAFLEVPGAMLLVPQQLVYLHSVDAKTGGELHEPRELLNVGAHQRHVDEDAEPSCRLTCVPLANEVLHS